MDSVFTIAGSAMQAQSVRLNVTASNLANADSVTSSTGGAYRARQPVFGTFLDQARGDRSVAGVRVEAIVEDPSPLPRVYDPNSPHADATGYVERSNVNVVEEMANMMSAARSYQGNAEMLNTAKDLMLQTLQLGR